MGHLYELWPTAPPEPACSFSAHVSQGLAATQIPSDTQDCHSVPVPESLGWQFAVHSCGRHRRQSLETVSLLSPLWPTGWALLGSLIRTSTHLHEQAEYFFPEVLLCLSFEGFLAEVSSGWCGHGLSAGLPAAQPSLASPPLCEKRDRMIKCISKSYSACERLKQIAL